MTGATCPRCHGPLPEAIVRELPRGAQCPFCTARLERSAGQTAIEVAKADDGYASLQATRDQKPPAAPVKTAAAPVTAAAAPAAQKNMRATMVGAAVVPRALPFEGAPAPIAIALSPPAAPAPARAAALAVRAIAAPAASTPPVRGEAAAALARTIAAPAPTRSPSVRPSVAPAAGKLARSLTPAQALDLPPPTPAPVLKTPSPILKASSPAIVAPLVTETESEPTHVMPPTPKPADASGPSLVFPDPEEGVIDSVTMGPDDAEPSGPVAPAAQPPPAPPPRAQPSPLAPVTQPRRGLALIAVGMGVAIVGVVVLGVKLLSGPKTVAPTPVAADVARPAPQVEAVAAAPEPSAPPGAAPKAAPKPKAESAREVAKRERLAAKEAKRAAKQAKLAAKREQAAAKRAQVAAKRESVAAKRAAARQAKADRRTARRGHKVAMHEPAAKAAPAPSGGDPRPLYEKGNALLFSGDGKGAIVAYREAVRLAPNDPIGFRGLGLAYEQQGETAAAVKALRRYLKLAPSAPDREIIGRRIDRLSHRPKK